MRIIKREMADKEYNRVRGSVLDRNIYIVQKHRKFLGIGYWKTLIRTTSWRVAKNIYYYLLWKGFYYRNILRIEEFALSLWRI